MRVLRILPKLGAWHAFSAVTLIGCGLQIPVQGTARLAERKFILQSVEGAPVLSGVPAQLAFSNTGFSAFAGCNTLSGSYTFEADRFVTRAMIETAMGCAAIEHERDAALSHLLASKPHMTHSGATLTLTHGSTRLVFVDRVVADPNRPLAATMWEVDVYVEGGTAMGLMGIERPRLTFSEDGTWSLQASCASGQGHYKVEGARVRLSVAAFGETRPCTDDNARESASFVRSVLSDGSLDYQIEARQLTLKGKARSLGLFAEK